MTETPPPRGPRGHNRSAAPRPHAAPSRPLIVPAQEQHIACLTCGNSDRVRSDQRRATHWPPWTPGFHPGVCPLCGGDAWAAQPRAWNDDV